MDEWMKECWDKWGTKTDSTIAAAFNNLPRESINPGLVWSQSRVLSSAELAYETGLSAGSVTQVGLLFLVNLAPARAKMDYWIAGTKPDGPEWEELVLAIASGDLDREQATIRLRELLATGQ